MKRRPVRVELEWLTELLWCDPPCAVVHQIYQEARRAIRWQGAGTQGDPVLARQPWLRKVSAEFHRRLRAADIHVEEREP